MPEVACSVSQQQHAILVARGEASPHFISPRERESGKGSLMCTKSGFLDKAKAVFLEAAVGSQAGHPKATTIVVKKKEVATVAGQIRLKLLFLRLREQVGRAQWQRWRAERRTPSWESEHKCRGCRWLNMRESKSHKQNPWQDPRGRARPTFHSANLEPS